MGHLKYETSSGVTRLLMIPGPIYKQSTCSSICSIGCWQIVCEAHMAHTRGVWGHALPENFEKLDPLRLNLRVFLTLMLYLVVPSLLP